MTVSMVELFIRNAIENDAFLVTAMVLLGGMVYYIIDPLLDFSHKLEEEPEPQQVSCQALYGSVQRAACSMLLAAAPSYPCTFTVHPGHASCSHAVRSVPETACMLQQLQQAAYSISVCHSSGNRCSILYRQCTPDPAQPWCTVHLEHVPVITVQSHRSHMHTAFCAGLPAPLTPPHPTPTTPL
jgi:hypothetical protein